VVDVGCGTGAFTSHLANLGHEVVGMDSSPSGIEIARAAHPELTFIHAPAEGAPPLPPFDVATSLEVVEHCFLPRDFARGVRALLKPGGRAIFSTPYHGYLKNLLIALAGRFDAHVDPLSDYGHIKFWSERTLRTLLTDSGFEPGRMIHAGRIPPLAKSLIAVASRPHDPSS
jgi:2-polyprenyl-6-hydroxyphenyl methylase/3-demethylubiquinone-9 3-methyltransferase